MTRGQKLKLMILSYGNDPRTTYLGGYGSGLTLAAVLSVLTENGWVLIVVGVITMIYAQRRHYKELGKGTAQKHEQKA